MSVYKVWQFLKKLNMKLPDDLEISLPGMHLKELKAKGLPWPSQGQDSELPMQGAGVQPLVRDPRSRLPHSMAKKKNLRKKKKKELKAGIQTDTVVPCPLQHYLQQPRGGSNPHPIHDSVEKHHLVNMFHGVLFTLKEERRADTPATQMNLAHITPNEISQSKEKKS